MWISFLFLSGISYSTIFAYRQYNAPKIFQNVILAGSGGALTALLLKPLVVNSYKKVGYFDTITLCNGLLIGYVSVSAGVDRIEPWAALTIGAIGAIIYIFGCKLIKLIKLDDPLEGTVVNLLGGTWSLIASGFFDTQYGLFYTHESKGRYFGIEFLGLFAVSVWVSITAFTFFWALLEFNLLRVSHTQELLGYDLTELEGLSKQEYELIEKEVSSRILREKEERRKVKDEENALMKKSLFILIGGRQGVKKIVSKLYKLIRNDPALLRYYDDDELLEMNRMEKYLTRATGGPSKTAGKTLRQALKKREMQKNDVSKVQTYLREVL